MYLWFARAIGTNSGTAVVSPAFDIQSKEWIECVKVRDTSYPCVVIPAIEVMREHTILDQCMFNSMGKGMPCEEIPF